MPLIRNRMPLIRNRMPHLLTTYCFHNTDGAKFTCFTSRKVQILTPEYKSTNTDMLGGAVFSINTTLLHSLRSWLKKNLKISIPVMYGWRGTPFPHPVTLSLAIGIYIYMYL
jgi:hypothetical protein